MKFNLGKILATITVACGIWHLHNGELIGHRIEALLIMALGLMMSSTEKIIEEIKAEK